MLTCTQSLHLSTATAALKRTTMTHVVSSCFLRNYNSMWNERVYPPIEQLSLAECVNILVKWSYCPFWESLCVDRYKMAGQRHRKDPNPKTCGHFLSLSVLHYFLQATEASSNTVYYSRSTFRQYIHCKMEGGRPVVEGRPLKIKMWELLDKENKRRGQNRKVERNGHPLRGGGWDKPKRSSVSGQKGSKNTMRERRKDRDREDYITKHVSRFIFLTNVLDTNRTRCIVKVYAADVQGVQLGYVMSSYLHTGQRSSLYVWNMSSMSKCFSRLVSFQSDVHIC